MDLTYQQPPPYPPYGNRPWSGEYKAPYAERDDELNREGGLSTSETPADFNVVAPHSRRPSMLKVEEDYSSSDIMWHDRQPEQSHYPARHYTHPAIPTHTHHPSYTRIDPNFAASYAQPAWPMSQSGSNTPTPAYGGSVDSYGPPVQYTPHPTFNFNTDPTTAVSMSPQSSQGGWASAASSDGVEHRYALHSPPFRPVSPQLVLRPDGIRKKNARFEIPKERNLATIDALIAASTDDNEKKELKQQKRLLRNRQAALDSRQRKKSHTEKLEQEKKVHEKKMYDLEELVANLEQQLQIQEDQWLRQRQQYEMQIQQLIHDRDEVIRAKTLEAAECRRQVNAMREYIREHQIDRQSQRVATYAPASDPNTFTSDFGDFSIDDDWERELSLFNDAELDVSEPENGPRQATPKPQPANNTKKAEADFSWNTFYMCLLFGAVVVSAGGRLSQLTSTHADVSLPSVSDEYRADAENVLKAVMSSDPQSAQEMIPLRSATGNAPPAATAGSAFGSTMPLMPKKEQSGLDRLSTTLTTASRQQELQQMFAMSAESYNHIANPLSELDDDADADLPDSPKQSRLEQYMASLSSKKDEIEKASYQSRTAERSVLSDHVPESVMADFRAFVHQSNAHQMKTETRE